MADLRLRLVHPDGEVFNDLVAEVELPTTAGPITILPEHMPLVSRVGTGVVAIRGGGSDRWDHYAVSGGMVTVANGEVVIATDAAEHADTIDELLVRQAIEEGKKTLETELTDTQVASIAAAVQRNLGRLEAFERHRRHHGAKTPRR